MEEAKKRTLYVGAHPDDVFISSAISIRRNPRTSCVLTVATGVSCEEYPAEFFGMRFDSKEDFVLTRIGEDIAAMDLLGVDTERNYFNFQVENEQTFQHIGEIVDGIKRLIVDGNIKRVVTHEFPQAHPDHEVVSFCAHKAGKDLGVEVWEYPMYCFIGDRQIDLQFLSDGHRKSRTFIYTGEEKEARGIAVRTYASQEFIVDRFNRDFEVFGQIDRDFAKMPDTKYFYGDIPGRPTPKEIRDAIATYRK